MADRITDDMVVMALTNALMDTGLPLVDANKAAERWMADHPAKTEGRGGLMDCEGWLASATRPVWDGPMVVVLKNGNRGRVRAMQTCDRLPALFQVQLSDNGVCEVRESEIDHYLTPPESKTVVERPTSPNPRRGSSTCPPSNRPADCRPTNGCC